MRKSLELAIGVLNGAVGDYLVRTGNGLATPMECIHEGRSLPIDQGALARAHPSATPRVAILAHGMMCTESIWDFPRGEAGEPGGDYGVFLARDLGYTPFYLRYNSGLAIPENGVALARLLETLVERYPVPIEEILLLGYSLGGLIARSACHVAAEERMTWLPKVRRAIYVGTPHRGAPLERYGRVVAKILSAVDDPYTRLVAQIADLRSDGVKDLGDADLRHEDRARRVASVSLRDPHHPVPLLPTISHHLIAGTVSEEPWISALFGDSIVPVPSATDGHTHARGDFGILPGHVKVLPGVPHIGLAHHAGVYEHIRGWCQEDDA